MFGLVDSKFETSVERQFRADDLIGKRGTLHEILAAIDVALGNQVGNDIVAALFQLLRCQLVRFIHQGKIGCRASTLLRLFVSIIGHDAARSQ